MFYTDVSNNCKKRWHKILSLNGYNTLDLKLKTDIIELLIIMIKNHQITLIKLFKKIIHIDIYLIIIILFFGSCKSPVKTNIIQSSFDIKQSKTNGVFVAEYVPSTKVLEFNGQGYYIQQVWIEHPWLYKDQKRNLEIRKSVRGFIKLENDDNIFDLNFIRDDLKSGGIMGRKLFFNISELQDTLSFQFYLNNDTIPIQMYKN